MKISILILFLSIVLTIFTAVNSYIFIRSVNWFNSFGNLSIYLKIIFWFVVLAYPFGRLIERVWTNHFVELLVKIGSFWMGFMLYLFLFFLLVDIARLVVYILPISGIKGIFTVDLRLFITKYVYLVTVLLVIISYINAQFPRTSNYQFSTSKPIGEKIRIVGVSDIHLGTVISKARLKKLVNQINKQKPDVVLLAGDIFDEDIRPVVNNGLGESFTKISSRLGVYAITGNHEFFGGVEAKVKYLEKWGVKFLRDSSIFVDGRFTIVGRDDRQVKFSTGKDRKSLSDLVANVDKSRFVILLDHQPFNLNEAVANGIDLQVSGHTHHGQLWPFNYITSAIYELSSGYLQKDKTHFIVSNGYGTWGPPLRLGNRPEILVIDLVEIK